MKKSFSKRVVTLQDMSSLKELFMNYELKAFGERQTSEEEIQEMVGSIPETDRIGLWHNGELAALSILTEKDHRLPSLILANPNEHMDHYIKEMVKELLSSARTRKMMKGENKTIILSANLEVEKKTLEQCGFTATRFWFQMKKDLEDLTNTSIPSSYQITSFNPDTEAHCLHELFEEVFSDHFDYHPTELEEFKKRFLRPTFDPTLWYLLKEGDNLIGFILCTVNEETRMGEVSHLGIQRSLRRRGLAHHLLHYAFHQLKERGMKTAALSVDSDSYTDATIVYQKAGMYVYRGFTRYDLNI
ncbi:GNAT family N-acetyltransferase [Rossellomorea vietnamensis]|uniref:GNAT family N-acetyltransferase n=1 Tax=Rossellomorea vietnamensis TaxID=218284 RepID=A0ACD4C8X3_9BACI|nr:GNAT family N-acetyltransferase [Rossellomorea vietnamensis]UXH44866.1 GNAT family N-acetyltransferase [Rossellomorea vietnamensis]